MTRLVITNRIIRRSLTNHWSSYQWQFHSSSYQSWFQSTSAPLKRATCQKISFQNSNEDQFSQAMKLSIFGEIYRRYHSHHSRKSPKATEIVFTKLRCHRELAIEKLRPIICGNGPEIIVSIIIDSSHALFFRRFRAVPNGFGISEKFADDRRC